jgi:hypothetical protein
MRVIVYSPQIFEYGLLSQMDLQPDIEILCMSNMDTHAYENRTMDQDCQIPSIK